MLWCHLAALELFEDGFKRYKEKIFFSDLSVKAVTKRERERVREREREREGEKKE